MRSRWTFKIIIFMIHLLVMMVFSSYAKAFQVKSVIKRDQAPIISAQVYTISNQEQLREVMSKYTHKSEYFADQTPHFINTSAVGRDQLNVSDNKFAVRNFISATDVRLLRNTFNGMPQLNQMRNLYYVDLPLEAAGKVARGARNRAAHEVAYFKQKANLFMLSALSGSSAVNWFFVTDGTTAQTKATIVLINTILYATFSVKSENWNLALEKSELLFDKVRNSNKITRRYTTEKIASTAGGLSVSAAYYYLYGYAVKGILNSSDLSALVDRDMFFELSRGTGLGLFASTSWDLILRSWLKKGYITKATLKKTMRCKAIVMAILVNMNAAKMSLHGIDGTIGMKALGYTGVVVISTGYALGKYEERYIKKYGVKPPIPENIKRLSRELKGKTRSFVVRGKKMLLSPFPKRKIANTNKNYGAMMCRNIFAR